MLQTLRAARVVLPAQKSTPDTFLIVYNRNKKSSPYGQERAHVQDFIEVFFSPRDPNIPYHVITWRDGGVVDVAEQHNLAEIATFCATAALPVLCSDEKIRKQLRLCGIAALRELPHAPSAREHET
jgi:hypothetical protein